MPYAQHKKSITFHYCWILRSIGGKGLNKLSWLNRGKYSWHRFGKLIHHYKKHIRSFSLFSRCMCVKCISCFCRIHDPYHSNFMIPILVVICLSCFIVDFFTVFVVEICSTFLPSTGGVILLLIYLLLFILSLVSYIRTTFTHPGYIPRNWKHPRAFDLHHTQQHNYCRKCLTYQVSRSFHCPSCSKCILRMDHHCIWVNNCIGAGNHKYYILTMIYTWLISLITLISGIVGLISVLQDLGGVNFHGAASLWLAVKLCVIIFSFTYSILWLFIITPSLILSCRCIIHNLTRIERLQMLQALQTGQQDTFNSYDRGSWVANVKEFMGRNPLLWLFPTSPHTPVTPDDWIQPQHRRHHPDAYIQLPQAAMARSGSEEMEEESSTVARTETDSNNDDSESTTHQSTTDQDQLIPSGP